MIESSTSGRPLPKSFVWRRIHSLAGLWLVVYLILHLLTNSQAALFIGDDGRGFIQGVNSIHELPYLLIIEILILAVPIIIHTVWGIKYIRSAEYNSFGSNQGETPYLPEYPRNKAYTWQRITSWLLVVGIIAHVIHMRIIEYPLSAYKGNEQFHMVRVTTDDGLYTLAQRIGITLYDQKQIAAMKSRETENRPQEDQKSTIDKLINQQTLRQDTHWLEVLEKRPLKDGEVMAVANNFGAVELLMLRDTFKMPVMLVLYTLLVLAACFHAFNGLWTALISWGITLTERSQKIMRTVTNVLMVVVAAIGLAAVWMTYWINLKS